ncbi:MAG: UvrD-helicase domain-containing protein [Alphaproteobacteria bacterium]|nr:UvrD-helicase domain-containing protein [Alphaproteobacteria bacterium]
MNLMLQNLNPEQLTAVETTNGPLLVLSGAGTGKTRVLVTRIAYILDQKLAMPWQILALTFTNKAANEMKNRIAEMLSENDSRFYANDLWCGTFHSICLRILRTNAVRAGLKPDFLIFGEDDQKSVLKNVFASIGADTKEFASGEWVEKLSNIKDAGRNNIDIAPRTKQILDLYNAELRRLNAVDFGDIILFVLDLLQNAPDVLEKYQHQFKYIMVDEFQDTNNAQMQLLQLLTRGISNPNICCVGDDDQSIYSWRGAEIKNILEFDKNFPGATIIRLETNYRSTGNILGAANSLIKHNNGRMGKDLRPVNNENMGEPVYVLTLPSNYDEANLIADTIARQSNGNFSKFAVLIRTGSLSRQFEEEFTKSKIPYRLVGTTKFYDRMEIRDVIAYIRLLVHPSDDISFARIIQRPRRGFGPSAIAKMRLCGADLMTGIKNAKFGGKQGIAANDFIKSFDFDWANITPADAVKKLLDDTGYMKFWHESKDSDAEERLANIRELITNVISGYQTLPEFLEHAALMTTDDNDTPDGDRNAQAVNIMTIHAAKGLEFDTVFLPAWEDGIFPNDKAIKEGGLEEERRLAYVALTRAKRRAIITNAMSRVIFGSRQYYPPARFIAEMDGRFLDFGGRRPSPQYEQKQNYNRHTSQKPTTERIVGKLVIHQELGRGVVIEEHDDILTIAFTKVGIKKVARKFVTFAD